MSVRRAVGAGEWAEALAHRPGATAFHSWEWLEWVAPLVRSHFVPLLIVDGAGASRGVAPVLLHRRALVGSVNWLPFPYLGPVTDAELYRGAVRALRDWCLMRGIVDIQLAQHPSAGRDGAFAAGLAGLGFAVTREATYVHDLRGASREKLLAGMSRQRRSAIQRCEREGMSVGPATLEEIRTCLPQIHHADMARHGLHAAYTDDLGRKLAERAPQVDMRITASRLGDGTTTGLLAVLGGQTTLCWLGGSIERYRGSNATALLYWDAIVWALESGSQWIDLVGIPTPGIETFKKRFGGTRVEYPVGHRSWLGYDRMRRMVSPRTEDPSAAV